MNKAALYTKCSIMPKRDARETLETFADILKKRLDKHCSVLDAGSGPGDLALEVLLPSLPANFKRLVGVDVSEEMVKYARETQVHPKVSFEHFDMNVELEKQELSGSEPFDLIFSSFAMMWIPNQKLCLQNFHKLLKPKGSVLLNILGNCPLYQIYKDQSLCSEWTNYMTDVDKMITPYHFTPNPAGIFRDLLIKCEFTDCDVKVHEKSVICSIEQMKDLVICVNPFIERMPAEIRQKYFDDYMHRLVQQCDASSNDPAQELSMPYKLLVAYGRKV